MLLAPEDVGTEESGSGVGQPSDRQRAAVSVHREENDLFVLLSVTVALGVVAGGDGLFRSRACRKRMEASGLVKEARGVCPSKLEHPNTLRMRPAPEAQPSCMTAWVLSSRLGGFRLGNSTRDTSLWLA